MPTRFNPPSTRLKVSERSRSNRPGDGKDQRDDADDQDAAGKNVLDSFRVHVSFSFFVFCYDHGSRRRIPLDRTFPVNLP